jgi:cell division septum initiation protein DivIVA
MLRQDSSSFMTDIHPNGSELENGYSASSSKSSQGLELQQQLQHLEEMIVLDGFKVPMTGRTVIDEEQILTQLLAVERSIPETIRVAEKVLNQRDEIIARAKQYSQELVKSAEQRAAQIADEQTIIQQIEAEGQQLRNQVQLEVEEIRRRNLSEIERVRRQTQHDLDAMRQNARQERDQIQRESDQYADRALADLELQLGEMMRVVKNGRVHLKSNTPKPQPQVAPTQTNAPKSKREAVAAAMD